MNIGRRDARSRIAHLLCEIATRLDVGAGRNRFVFPFAVTQFHLADASGITPVHVNRVLKALRTEGIADVAKGEVHVLDWEALARVGDFDRQYLQTAIRPENRMRIVPEAH